MATETIETSLAEEQPPENVVEEQQEVPIELVMLNGLIILPPRQEHTGGDTSRLAHAIALPPLRAEEPVQSLRAALAEVVGYAHLTNFRFEVCDKPVAQNGSSKTSDPPLISPYTGKEAVVSVPLAVKSLENTEEAAAGTAASGGGLDEFGNLTPLVRQGWHEREAAFEIVLERYDVANVRDHVQRLRGLLAGNAPSVKSLNDEEPNADVPPPEQEAVPKEAPSPEMPSGEDDQKEDATPKKPLPPLPIFAPIEKSVDGTPKLKNFFYYVSGEDPATYRFGSAAQQTEQAGSKSSKKKRKSKTTSPKAKSVVTVSDDEGEEILSTEELLSKQLPRWNELDEQTKVPASIQYGGFHPPPVPRRLMGDLAYLEVHLTPTDAEPTTIHITATPTGFYVNNCSTKGTPHFDPSPASQPCFSHTLLDCLLQASETFRNLWSRALTASQARGEILKQFNNAPVLSLFRLAVRGDFAGFPSAASASSFVQQQLDGSLNTPSWLVPRPSRYPGADAEGAWNGNQFHTYNTTRAEEEMCSTYGVDLRNGGIRDWNEELQMAREMPVSTLSERIERARVLHKVMTEFGEAALVGVKSISDGHIAPMNPNEGARSQVFLHNNIFFSRAVDAGPETFKVARGDRAAKKAANRDIQCIGTFHRSETSGLYTLATVLIDYLGTRYVCQSILPGILTGEKSHTLLYGSVETRVPLKWNEDLHNILEETVGEAMMVATRPVFRHPLTEERMAEIQRLSEASPFHAELEKKLTLNMEEEKVEPNAVIKSCIPVEAKGILGSDHRKYLLDFGRLTPRDANWVPESKGGTGNFEAARKINASGASKLTTAIPLTLEDDEWTMNVLRPELVNRFTQNSMAKYMQEKNEKQNETLKETQKDDDKEKAESGKKDDTVQKGEGGEDGQNELVDNAEDKKKKEENKNVLSEEDINYYKSLKLNLNVFLPYMKSFHGVNEDAAEQMKLDEQRAREAAAFLWDEILPKITRAVRDGSIQQIPVDGKTLTEFLHRNGVNCRYLGRLAFLAREEEGKDQKTEADLSKGRLTVIERRIMPKCWLELLECEMVARAAKHVLDTYLTEHGGVAAMQPAQTIASFFSALVSDLDETAAQTEARMEKRPDNEPEDDDVGALTISDTGGAGDAVTCSIRSRHEVWQDIELEVGRRFRYSLSLYNSGNKYDRALYTPLLRRVCQRTGVRIVAKSYDVGRNCFCGNTHGGRLAASYPISPLDIADILPLMKHAAAYNEGFSPCSFSPSIAIPALQVSLRDARNALERAHIQTGGRALGRGLELAQEAASLYQRVTENPAHPGIIDTVELMASIFLDAGDPEMAAANASKALSMTVQSAGFDTASTFTAHMTLFQMYHASRDVDRAVKHLRAAIYILEILAGPRHIENFTAFHKLGNVYSSEDYAGKYLPIAKGYLEEATKRDSGDRLMDGITSKSLAKVLASMGQYSEALEAEKKAFKVLSMFLGAEHHLTKDSDVELKGYAKLAVEKGNRTIESESMQDQVAKADAVAAALAAEEDKRSTKKNKKKKGKK